ncbi:MAG: cren protein [Hyperthermus sp.]|nr:MAG: cren protein [Hyperthermus sp.]
MAPELRERLVPVRVNKISDLARVAATIITLGQPAYLVRFTHNGRRVYAIIAVLRDYYKYYGLPMIYYYVDEEDKFKDGSYLLVKVDDQGEQIELSKGIRHGWVAIPIIDLAEKPSFVPDDL